MEPWSKKVTPEIIFYDVFITNQLVIDWLIVCCLTPYQQYFSLILAANQLKTIYILFYALNSKKTAVLVQYSSRVSKLFWNILSYHPTTGLLTVVLWINKITLHGYFSSLSNVPLEHSIFTGQYQVFYCHRKGFEFGNILIGGSILR